MDGIPGWSRYFEEVSGAGDINKDGYADVIIGDPAGWGDFGEVLVFLGGRYMDGEFDIGFQGLTTPYRGAGRSVGRCGDVNGDGVDDILFGAVYHFSPRGKVMIFSGDSTITVSEEYTKPKVEYPVFVQNLPNPFSGETIIRYSSPSGCRVSLKVYDTNGRLVRVLVEQDGVRSGQYRVRWDGGDNNGKKVPSGTYFLRLEAGNYSATRKVCVMR